MEGCREISTRGSVGRLRWEAALSVVRLAAVRSSLEKSTLRIKSGARTSMDKQTRLTAALERETRFGMGASFRSRRQHDVMDADHVGGRPAVSARARRRAVVGGARRSADGLVRARTDRRAMGWLHYSCRYYKDPGWCSEPRMPSSVFACLTCPAAGPSELVEHDRTRREQRDRHGLGPAVVRLP